MNVQIHEKTFPLISSITDSTGRVINFTYSGDNIVITINAPGTGTSVSYTYKRSLNTKYVYNNGALVDTYQYHTLDYVQDPIGRKIYYENYYYYNGNQWPIERFSFGKKTMTNCESVSRYLLGAVIYPGSKTIYEYEPVIRNLGPDGVYDAYRVKARYDKIQRKNSSTQLYEWSSDLNRLDYSYGGDCSGYPDYSNDETIPATYQFWSEAASMDGRRTKTVFNGVKQRVQVENKAANNEKQVTKYSEFDTKYKFRPKKTETSEYAGSGFLVRTLYTYTTYNDWGGISSATMPLTLQQYNDANVRAKYTTNYYYENSTYKYYLTRTQWYQSETKSLSETYSYNASGRVSGSTNAKGETTSYAYTLNTNNSVTEVSVTKPLGGGKTAQVKTVYGSETSYAYPKEVILYYTNDQGTYTSTKTTYTYDMLLGLVTSETDNENKTASYTYDSLGRVTQIQYPGFSNINGNNYSVRQTYEYVEGYNNDYIEGNYTGIYGTAVNACTHYTNLTYPTTNLYNQSSSLYDAYGSLRQERLWEGTRYITRSKYTYDNLQRVRTYTDAANNTISQSYDAWGQANEVTDASGNLYVSNYDVTSNKVVSFFVAAANIASYRANTASNTYKENYIEVYLDQFGRTSERRVYQNWPALSGTLSELYRYDITGNLTGYTDPKRNLNEDGVTASYTYDELDRLLRVKDALNQITVVGYDALGNVISVGLKENAQSTVSIPLYTKAYDELGSLRTKTDPSAQVTGYSYNSLGLGTKTVDRNGSTLTAAYDGLNRLMTATQTSQDGTKSIGYRYNYSNPFGFDEEKMYLNGSATPATNNQYAYDAFGRIVWKGVSGNGYLSSALASQYDNAGRLTGVGALAQNNSFFSQYKYTNDRLTKVQTNGSQTVSASDADNATYEYYPDGKLKKITYPKLNDGTYLTSEYLYNTLGRLTSLTNKRGSTVLSRFTYTYDENGNITSVNDGQTTRSYTYDKLNRLVSIMPQAGSGIVYTYDLRGNRKTEINSQTGIDIVDIAYSYDMDNKLASVTKGTATTTMAYYADGMRAKKTTASGTTHYIYNLAGKMIAEANGTATVTANYVWGPDRALVKKVTGGGEYYYLYNGHGDVIQIVDRNGNIVNNYKYDEWGNIEESNETISNPFKYAGEVYDEETGLYYLRARYYDPALGRFINEDTYEGQINNPLTLNLYTYCFNNPPKYVDSTGNMPVKKLNELSSAYNKGIYPTDFMSK